MSSLNYLPLVLFAVLIASDYFLARRIRKAVKVQRLDFPCFDNFSFGGSPLGIVLNLLRLRQMPATNEFSDPDHIAIQRHYHAQQLLFAYRCSPIPRRRDLTTHSSRTRLTTSPMSVLIDTLPTLHRSGGGSAQFRC
jgi:hypothetical protein